MKTALSEKDIDDTIVKESNYRIGDKTTVVCLTLKNGFEVIGTSACVDPVNYDHSVGVEYARKRAKDKVWELEGYRLQCQLADPVLDPEPLTNKLSEYDTVEGEVLPTPSDRAF